jgi:hypothetical protein
VAHLEENVAAALITLSDEQFQRLDRVSRAGPFGVNPVHLSAAPGEERAAGRPIIPIMEMR